MVTNSRKIDRVSRRMDANVSLMHGRVNHPVHSYHVLLYYLWRQLISIMLKAIESSGLHGVA